jgi:peroxiredoxin
MAFRPFILWGIIVAVMATAAGLAVEPEGQRAKPELIGGLGETDFAITCRERLCGLYCNQGVAWLHGGDARQAARAFSEAACVEPDCAMAWWGLGMANVADRATAARYAAEARGRAGAASPRERLWITALSDYLDEGTSELDRRAFMVQSLDRIATSYPEDTEARAFLVRQLLDNRDAGMRLPLTSAVDAMLSEILRAHPRHPAQRYRMLLWAPDQPGRARDSAAVVEKCLSSVPQALTDAGRIHARLSRDEDAIRCFRASAAAADAQLRDGNILPAEMAGHVENTDLLLRSLARAGCLDEAVALARHLIGLASPAEEKKPRAEEAQDPHGHTAARKEAESPAVVGQRALLEVLLDFQLWDELMAAAQSPWLESADAEIRARRRHALGLAHFVTADGNALAADLGDLRQLAQFAPPAMTPTRQREYFRVTREFIAELESCAAILDAAEKREAITPLAQAIPLERRAPVLLCFHDNAGAEAAARRAVELSPGNAAPGLMLVRVLAGAGKGDAAPALAGLLERHPKLDPHLLPAGVVRPAGVPGALAPAPVATWEPRVMPPLPFLDPDGRATPLTAFRGKAVVLVFYLGIGCVHCIDQLKAFAPLANDYAQAGITIIAAGTDSAAGLKETLGAVVAGETAPFLMVSDEKLHAFREAGVFDDLTQKPVHGTFLIDREGRILWRNVSTGPFMATRNLLEEAKRVLALDPGKPAASAPARASAAGSP